VSPHDSKDQCPPSCPYTGDIVELRGRLSRIEADVHSILSRLNGNGRKSLSDEGREYTDRQVDKAEGRLAKRIDTLEFRLWWMLAGGIGTGTIAATGLQHALAAFGGGG
jgi:hypothetical protein